MSVVNSVLTFMFRNNIRGGGVIFKSPLNSSRKINFENKYGLKMKLDPFDYVQLEILKNGFYESEVYEAIVRDIRSGDTFWDIGSNIGLHALTVKKNYPNVDCVAFEPLLLNYRKLEINERLNGLEIEKHFFALGDKLGSSRIFWTPQNLGRTGLIQRDKTVSSEDTVRIFTIDYLVLERKFKLPNIIKMDVEGFELNILKGAKDTLNNRALRKIIFEAQNNLGENSVIVDILKNAGFTIRVLSRNEKTGNALTNYCATR